MHKLIHDQSHEPLVNYLRVHRFETALTQSEVGQVLGYPNESAVSHHERFTSVPPFLMALGYEILFQQPTGIIFLGLKQTLEPGIEKRLAELEHRLRKQGENHPRSATIARKLEWLAERRSSGHN